MPFFWAVEPDFTNGRVATTTQPVGSNLYPKVAVGGRFSRSFGASSASESGVRVRDPWSGAVGTRLLGP
jgi:hypothetical protein